MATVTRVATDVVVDVPMTELEADPYPRYAQMRQATPICWVPESERLWITTYDLCAEAGNDDTVFGPTQEVHHRVYGQPNVMAPSGPEHLEALVLCARRAAGRPRAGPRRSSPRRLASNACSPSTCRRAGTHDGTTIGHMLARGRPVAELLADLGVMIVGGLQEPAHGTANTTLGLLSHPDRARSSRTARAGQFEELLSRLPGLRLDPERAPWVHGRQVRAAKRLPVIWDA